MKNRKILQTFGATVGLLVIGFSLPLSSLCSWQPSTCSLGYEIWKSWLPTYDTKEEALDACEAKAAEEASTIRCLVVEQDVGCKEPKKYGALACIKKVKH